MCLFVFSSVFVFVFALSQAASQVGWQGGSVPVVLLGFKEEIRLTPKFGPIKRHSPTSSSSSPSSVTANHQQQQAAIICDHIFRFVGRRDNACSKFLTGHTSRTIHWRYQFLFWKISPAPRGRYKGVAKSSSCVGHLRSHQFGIGGRADFLWVAPYV